MSKIVTLTAAAVGYVLGSRAGRGPYEKLAEQFGQVRSDPRVQEKVAQAQTVAQDKAKQAVSTVTEKVKDTAPQSSDDSSSTPSTTRAVDDDPSTPSSDTVGQAGTGPQGDLP